MSNTNRSVASPHPVFYGGVQTEHRAADHHRRMFVQQIEPVGLKSARALRRILKPLDHQQRLLNVHVTARLNLRLLQVGSTRIRTLYSLIAWRKPKMKGVTFALVVPSAY